MSFHGNLAAKSAGVSGVLGNFHFLNLFSQRGTVSGDQNLVSVARRSIGASRSETRRDPQAGMPYLVPYLPVTPTSTSRCQHALCARKKALLLTLSSLRHRGSCIGGDELKLLLALTMEEPIMIY